MLKFRTMRTDADRHDAMLTVRDDPRVTPLGRRLRRWHLDELPQLVNVVRGDMSLVGPRPEDPKYVRSYTADQRRTLAVRPGLTGAASLAYRGEAALLGDDPERTYLEAVMPAKLAIELRYMERRTPWSDVRLVAATISAVIGDALGRR